MTHADLTPDDWARLARHVAGDELPHESRDTAAWLAEDPVRAAAARDAAAVWALTHDLAAAAQAQRDVRAAQGDAGWRRMQDRLAAPSEASAPAPSAARPLARHRSRGFRVGTWAAAAVLVLAVGLGIRATRPETYAAPPGQRVTVFLADGTRADLHPGSRIVVSMVGVPGPWWHRFVPPRDLTRRVTLTGEAAFTVQHNDARPFRVEAGHAVIEDLGTTFLVRAYPGDAQVRVAVAEGEVAVQASVAAPGGAPTRLVPGQTAAVSASGRIAVASETDVSTWFGWTRDRLVFRQERLADVAAELTRWFGQPVAVRDSALAERRVSLDHPLTSPEAALTAVAAALGASLTLRGDTTWITQP